MSFHWVNPADITIVAWIMVIVVCTVAAIVGEWIADIYIQARNISSKPRKIIIKVIGIMIVILFVLFLMFSGLFQAAPLPGAGNQ